MKRFFFVAAILVTASISLAHAQDAATDGTIRVVREHIDYDINSDGTGTVTAEIALSPTIRGVLNAIGQRTIEYQEGMSEVELLEAYTLKTNGKRVDVKEDGILTQVPPAYAGASMFADMKIKRIIFPDVSIGDQVIYRYKRHILVPQFPNQYFDSRVFPKSMRHDDVRVTVRHARNHKLQFQARDLQSLPDQETDSHITHEWRFSNLQTIPEEPGAISNFDRDPVFEVSSFNEWSEIAKAYDARAKKQAAITPEIQKLADRIVGKNRDKRAQAAAIYGWVAANIRYVALYLGAGGYVPHSADSILANRYGDCKDYVTLTEALLAAKGIASTPVIINAGNRFTVPSIPTPAAFNHAILYLPDLNLYLDPTARTLPFGSLSPIEANKPVLHARNFGKLLTTPNVIASSQELKSDSTAAVNSEGSLTGVTRVSAVEIMAAQLRQLTSRMEDPQAAKQLGTSLLSLEGLTGTTKFSNQSDAITAGYKAEFAINNWINVPGPGAVRLPTGLLSASPIRIIVMQTLNTPAFKVERVCIPGVISETSAFELPSSITPTNLPKDVDVSNSVGGYRAVYVRQGTTVKATRTLTMSFPRTTCTPEESAQLREILEQARRDLSAQMTYQ